MNHTMAIRAHNHKIHSWVDMMFPSGGADRFNVMHFDVVRSSCTIPCTEVKTAPRNHTLGTMNGNSSCPKTGISLVIRTISALAATLKRTIFIVPSLDILSNNVLEIILTYNCYHCRNLTRSKRFIRGRKMTLPYEGKILRVILLHHSVQCIVWRFSVLSQLAQAGAHNLLSEFIVMNGLLLEY